MTTYSLLRKLIVIGFFTWTCFGVSLINAAESLPEDAVDIQSKMQSLIEYLDSQQYANLATFDEHVVLSFKKALNRNPKPMEIALLSKLHQSINLPRSAVLAYALKGENAAPSWESCRGFINKTTKLDFVPSPVIRNDANKLKSLGINAIKNQINQELRNQRKSDPSASGITSELASPNIAFQEYSIYFGYLHAHSALSDGEGTAFEAYESARNAGLDFFALTDHGELLIIWPWENKWQHLKDAAHDTYLEGTFVSLWGFEWSNPFLGHMNVINSADYTNALSVFSLYDFYDWIDDRPTAFAQFNHPGEYNDLGLEFYHFLPYPAVRDQVVGIETWNGNSSFDEYFYNGGYYGQFSYLDEANRLTWRLGALGSQDNHQKDWGTKNNFRTGVLATALTREAIIDAYKNRRFYATEDQDLKLDFSSKGYPMGSHLSGFFRKFEVEACDGSNDTFSQVRFYRNGILLKSESYNDNGSTCIEASFTDWSLWPSYYYVIVQQNDDNDDNGRNDEAISSAIWYQ